MLIAALTGCFLLLGLELPFAGCAWPETPRILLHTPTSPHEYRVREFKAAYLKSKSVRDFTARHPSDLLSVTCLQNVISVVFQSDVHLVQVKREQGAPKLRPEFRQSMTDAEFAALVLAAQEVSRSIRVMMLVVVHRESADHGAKESSAVIAVDGSSVQWR